MKTRMKTMNNKVIRSSHFEQIFENTKDFGRVQFVEKIEDLENKIDSLEETIDELERDKEDLEDDYNNLCYELEEYEDYEKEVDDIHKDIEWFMFKLRMDKCYTKALEEFIKNYGGELFN